MPKIYIDVLDKQAINYLSDGLRYLKVALNNNFIVPSDFIYKNTFEQLKNDLIRINAELENLYVWLNNIQNDYKKMLSNLNADVKKINDFDIKNISNKIKE